MVLLVAVAIGVPVMIEDIAVVEPLRTNPQTALLLRLAPMTLFI